MKAKRLAATAVAATATSTAGCASTDIEHYADNGPKKLVLEDYFLGQTTAYGVFEDRFGKIRRTFKVHIEGTISGNQLTLTEDFLYNDGERDQRIWVVDILGDGNYRGTAGDVQGYAIGKTAGNAFNWKYKVDLSVNGKIWKVGFDDWMYLLEDNVLINRAYVTRYGIRIGEVTISFNK